jgi:hypothetical protein
MCTALLHSTSNTLRTRLSAMPIIADLEGPEVMADEVELDLSTALDEAWACEDSQQPTAGLNNHEVRKNGFQGAC